MAYGWRPYVPVAKRREQAAKKIDKLRRKGQAIEPVHIEGRKIAKTFWGKAWCEHIESFSDYDNRLPRGRTYVRNGSVCHLSIQKGRIEGIVSGSDLYKIKGEIKPLPNTTWKKIKSLCSGQIGSALELLQGKLSDNIMSIVTDPKQGLFPSPKDIKLNCTCPDWADLCKHLAAALYGIGARLDDSPELLFLLRGVDYNELITTDIQLPSSGKGRRLSGDISDVFGIEISQPTENNANNDKQEKKPRKKQRLKFSNKKTVSKKNELVDNKKTISFKLTGTSVQKLRKRLEMNKTQFALLIGVSPPTITNWENKRGKLVLQEFSKESLFNASKLSTKEAWRKLS